MGKTYIRVNNIPVAQVYRIAVDNRDPYWVYAGLQDNHSWMGPSATRHWLGILNQDWVEIGFSDGTGKAVDKADWRKVYSSSSNGNLSLVDPMTGDTMGITPRPPAGEPAYRFDWDAPVMASRHTPGTVYLGGNRLFISKDYGSTWTRTKDLTRSINRDTLEMMGVAQQRHQAVAQRRRRHQRDLELRRVADRSEDPLGRDRRRQRAADDRRRRHMDRGERRDQRRQERHVRRRHRRVRGVARHGVRLVRRPPRRRLRAVHLPHDRLRQDLDGGDRRPAGRRRVDPRPRRVSRESRTCSSPAPSARCSSRTTAARTGRGSPPTCRRRATTTSWSIRARRISSSARTAAASGFSTTRRRSRSGRRRSRRSAAHLFAVPRATLMLYWEDVSNMDHYFYTAENPAEGAAFTYHLAQPAQKVRLIVSGAGRQSRFARSTGPGDAGVIHRVNWDLRYPVAARHRARRRRRRARRAAAAAARD